MESAEQIVKVNLSEVESLGEVLIECVDRCRSISVAAADCKNVPVITAAIDEASTILKLCNTARKTCEARRKEWVGPLNDHVKAYNAAVKAKLAPLVEAEQSLKRLTLDWNRIISNINAEAERKRRAEEERRRKIQAAHEAKGHEVKPEPTPVPYTPPVQTTAKVRKTWTFEVIDADKVPKEYLQVDVVGLGNAVRQGLRECAGVRIYQNEILVTA